MVHRPVRRYMRMSAWGGWTEAQIRSPRPSERWRLFCFDRRGDGKNWQWPLFGWKALGSWVCVYIYNASCGALDSPWLLHCGHGGTAPGLECKRLPHQIPDCRDSCAPFFAGGLGFPPSSRELARSGAGLNGSKGMSNLPAAARGSLPRWLAMRRPSIIRRPLGACF
ncbi:uncharacterized protein B0T15DRAFT_51408 [Chaetomium strumarium]|uniref:Uncharacterized protein n=1 Tax=Chaetomium strumarium TaxID=1170767 RepID=A0AAJ0M6F9_9PEZI|nr:hypothetical protein B0T15DRAFT_51408 [Chaetomium strumarium]